MTSHPAIEAIKAFAKRCGMEERTDVVIMQGAFAAPEEQRVWTDFAAHAPAPFASVQVYDTAISGDIDQSEAFSPDRAVTLTVTKPKTDGVWVFVFSEGFVSCLKDVLLPTKILCASLHSNGEFSARGLEVERWEIEKPVLKGQEPIKISPLAVRDYVPGREVAADLSPWILLKEPIAQSAEFRAWCSVAARKLLGSLANNARVVDGATKLNWTGPPLWSIRADSAEIATAFAPITAAATWVYCSGDDRDVRHLLFTSELARSSRPDLKLPAIVEHATECAKAAYEAHVQSASRETLKALADLRKTVVEETQKVTDRARDLTSDLWKGIAVTAAPFVVKQLEDTASAKRHELQALFYFGAAIFVLVSYWLQIRLDAAFFDNQERARGRWLLTLYNYISQSERKAIAEEPIAEALRYYKHTRSVIWCIYLLLVALLVIAGVRSLSLSGG